MKFIDEVRIDVRSGDGAPGCAHFRREKYKPRMGPDGGDGGKGGDVYFQATHQMQSLLDFKYITKYAAEDGKPGRGADKYGRGGEDLLVKVPVGTLIYDNETGELLADLVEPEKSVMLLRGGKGGMGNMHFATATRQSPEYAQPGLPGKSMKYRMELKLLADVALIGFPNAGKSTLISKWSSARPKIGDYPFTTLVPNLGVVRGQGLDFVLADIPGIIEGASEGKGLGHRFLRHAERTRALVVMLDLDPYTGRQLDEEFKTLLKELRQYSSTVGALPMCVALTKADIWKDQLKDVSLSGSAALECLLAIPELQEKGIQELFEELKNEKILDSTYLISSASDMGLDVLKQALVDVLTKLGPREYKNHIASVVSYGNAELFGDDDDGEGEFFANVENDDDDDGFVFEDEE